MKKKDLEMFRKMLEDQLNELLHYAGDTVNDMSERKENFPDPTDRASVETDRNFYAQNSR